MDLERPIATVIPTLDGPVLTALVRTTDPMTAGEVHRLAGSGSESGVRAVLQRLTSRGLVRARRAGPVVRYVANREHVAWPAIEALAGLRATLLDRIGAAVDAWPGRPQAVTLFESAAGLDDNESGLDLLVVQPGTDSDEHRLSQRLRADGLRDDLTAWTGGRCRIYALTPGQFTERLRAGDPVIEQALRDGTLVRGVFPQT